MWAECLNYRVGYRASGPRVAHVVRNAVVSAREDQTMKGLDGHRGQKRCVCVCACAFCQRMANLHFVHVEVDSNVTCLFCISFLVSCVVALVAQLVKDHLWRDHIQIQLVVVCRVVGRFQKPIEVTWN